MDLPLRIPSKDPKGRPFKLRLDVVSGSYVGLDTTLYFQIDIEENTDLKRDMERMRARKVRAVWVRVGAGHTLAIMIASAL